MRTCISPVEILLVTDEESGEGSSIINFFKTQHCLNSIHVVRNPKEAMPLMVRETEAPKLVVLAMKKVDDEELELMRTLKQNPETRSIPVIAMSKNPEEVEHLQRCQLDPGTIIREPFNFTKMIEALKRTGMYWLVLDYKQS